jgi:hypothetical protein
MYIEFQLPTGGGGMAAQYTSFLIAKNLTDWSNSYNIAYVKKNHKYTVRVTFDSDELYSFFAMTWRPKSDKMLSYLTNYRLIEPMNRV